LVDLLTGKTVYAVWIDHLDTREWIDHLDARELVGLSATEDYAKIIKRRLKKNVEGITVDIVPTVIGDMESIFL
jgi:hypothetical protein